MEKLTHELTRCPECWTSLSSSDDVKPCELHRYAGILAGKVGTVECDPDESERVFVIKFSPEFADGEHWIAVEASNRNEIIETFMAWADDRIFEGDRAWVSTDIMSRRELERLQDL